MPAIAIQNSFIDDEKTISYYDFVHPLYKIHDAGPPELIGTCFPIGIGIYLTAAHVFDLFEAVRNEFKNKSGEKAAPTREEMLERKRLMDEMRFLEGTNVNLAPLILDQAAIRQGQIKNLGVSVPVFVTVAYDFDLALLFVENDVRRNPEGQPTPIACLSIQETPTVGQKVVVAGFPGASNRVDVDEETGKVKAVGLEMVVNEGEIVEMYPVMRDTGIAFYPCIQTDIDIEPGHSGGPAFCKETLSVVGINSTGGFAGYGMLSWVGKALDAEMTIPRGLTIGDREVPAGGVITLRELGAAGLIEIY